MKEFNKKLIPDCSLSSTDTIFLILAGHIAVISPAITFPEIDFGRNIEIKACKIIYSKQAEKVIRAKS